MSSFKGTGCPQSNVYPSSSGGGAVECSNGPNCFRDCFWRVCVCLCVCVFVCIFVNVCVFVYICKCLCMFVFVYVFVYICKCRCTYVSICVCGYAHVHIFTHITYTRIACSLYITTCVLHIHTRSSLLCVAHGTSSASCH